MDTDIDLQNLEEQEALEAAIEAFVLKYQAAEHHLSRLIKYNQDI